MKTQSKVTQAKSQQKDQKSDLFLDPLKGLPSRAVKFLKALWGCRRVKGRVVTMSFPYMSKLTGMPVITCRRARRDLEALGAFTTKAHGKHSLRYTLNYIFFTEAGIAFMNELSKRFQKLHEISDHLYIKTKGYYYKLKSYLGDKKFYFFELSYNFKKNQKEKINKILGELKDLVDRPCHFISQKSSSIMKTIGYIEHPKSPEPYEPECVYVPKSQQPFGINVSQLWAESEKRESEFTQGNMIQRLAVVEDLLRNSQDGISKKEILHQKAIIVGDLAPISCNKIFSKGAVREALEAKEKLLLEQMSILDKKINQLEANQAALVQEKNQLEAALSKSRHVKKHQFALSV